MATPHSQAEAFVADLLHKCQDFVAKVKRIDGDDTLRYDRFVALLASGRKGLLRDENTARERLREIFEDRPDMLEELFSFSKIGQDAKRKRASETCDASHDVRLEKQNARDPVGVFDPKGTEEKEIRERLIKHELETFLRPLIEATESVKRLIEAAEDPKRGGEIKVRDYLTDRDLMCIRKLRESGSKFIKKIRVDPSLELFREILSCLRRSKMKSVDRLYELSLNV